MFKQGIVGAFPLGPKKVLPEVFWLILILGMSDWTKAHGKGLCPIRNGLAILITLLTITLHESYNQTHLPTVEWTITLMRNVLTNNLVMCSELLLMYYFMLIKSKHHNTLPLWELETCMGDILNFPQ